MRIGSHKRKMGERSAVLGEEERKLSELFALDPNWKPVHRLNLGLRKIKQETTALQIISFHRTQ